jgi:hypothetical protein
VQHKQCEVEKAHEVEVQHSHQQQDYSTDHSIECCPEAIIAVNWALRRERLVALAGLKF